jgi:hypothetical protein
MKRNAISKMAMCMSLCLCAGLAMGQDGQPPAKATKPAMPAPNATQPKVERPKVEKPATPHAAQPAHVDGRAPAAMPQGEMPKMSPEEAATHEAWMKSMTPGPEHAHMAKSAGEWDAVVSWRMAPDAPWTTEKGRETRTVIFNGLYVQSEFHGSMMGTPFTGKMIEGFNNVTRKLESVWIDSMSSGMMIQTGEMSSDGKTITMAGTCADPMTSKSKAVKTIITIADDSSHTMKMFDVDASGKEFESMKIEYTRGAKPSDVPNAPSPVPGGK